MEIRREKTAENNGEASIRLSYSRQFQHGGQTHTIDAEATLAVEADPQKREQVIRALEAGVEQLARQITQRGTRPAAAIPAGIPAGKTSEPARKGETTGVSPTAPLPVSESMPATPPASGGRTISLPYFIDYIKKRWNMSPKEAMDLLDVRELTGLNYREALYKLRAIKEPQSAAASTPAPSPPAGETPRQSETRSPHSHTQAAPPASAGTPAPGTGPATGLAAPRYENRVISPRSSSPLPTTQPASGARSDADAAVSAPERAPDFAGSPKAPLPIQLGVVRDAPAPAYRFEEEEEEDEDYDLPDDGDMLRQSAQFKLEELREVRGSNVASAERLGVLHNVIGEQISADQLERLIQVIWGITHRKRLKAQQVEALISWAKEDLFVEEAEAILRLLAEGEV